MPLHVAIPQKIETRRLIIRRCLEADYDGFFGFLNDREATRFLSLTADQKTSAGAQTTLWYIIHSYNTENPLFMMSVIDKENGDYLGSCGVMPLKEAGEFEFFYNIIRDRWGEGLATELVIGLMDYAFQTSSVNRMAAFINPDNRASLRVAEKVGMSNKGLVKHQDFKQPVLLMTMSVQAFKRRHGRSK